MALKISKVDVWAGEMRDQAGELARMLEALKGTNIQCVIARRQPDKKGEGIVFVSPVKTARAKSSAKKAGFKPAKMATLRVEGTNKAGLGAKMTRAIGDAGVNMRGVSAAVIGTKFVVYFGFDRAADASKAMKALKSVR